MNVRQKLFDLKRALKDAKTPERKAELLDLIEQAEHEAKRPVREEKVTVSFSEEEEEECED